MAQKLNFNTNEKLLLKTPYGGYEVEQPLIDIIKNPTIQKLKKVITGGCYIYSDKKYKDYNS